ncbi:MAG TPA: serine hydrolase domain-containing protein [Ktedonobacteraceae bacterium]|nr:serine hydrolase domain-containing protein [Ktedonobacteraceae bacterium]
MNDIIDLEELELVALEEIQASNAPGAAIVVIKDEEILFARGFGMSNSETRAPAEPDMLFRIGSVTKMITAYTLISLVQEQQVSVHAPIDSFVADLPRRLAKLTIHQLLSHTAGLKDDFSHYGPHDESALGKAVRHYGEQHFFAEPGQIFSYSALGYAVAGVVIEALSNKTYAQMVADRVLTPLKMERSTFYPTTAMTYPFSQGHIATGPQQWNVVRPYDDTAERWPSGFLFSSVTELSRLAIAFMNNGCIDGEQVLSPDVIAILMQSHSVPQESRDHESYGYGLGLGSYRGVHTVGHGGGRRGFVSDLRMVPEHRFAFIQLLNHPGRTLEKTKQKAMELLLPLEEQTMPASPPELPLTEAELQRFAGRYARPDVHGTAEQVIELINKEGKLLIQFSEKGKPLPVVRIGDTRFRFSMPAGSNSQPFEFTFRLGANEQEDYLCGMLRAHKRMNR